MRDLEAWSLRVPLQPKLHLQGRLYRERWLLSSRFRSHILLGIVSRRERIPLSLGRMRRGLQTLTNSTPINREAAGPATKNLSCYWVKHREFGVGPSQRISSSWSSWDWLLHPPEYKCSTG